jgi:hypothetical protein
MACESKSVIPLPQQTPFELHYMHALLRDLPRPLSVLEIGVYEGGTLWHAADAVPRFVTRPEDRRAGAGTGPVRVLSDRRRSQL